MISKNFTDRFSVKSAAIIIQYLTVLENATMLETHDAVAAVPELAEYCQFLYAMFEV